MAQGLISALEVTFNEMRYINLRFTYLLTYCHLDFGGDPDPDPGFPVC